MSIPLSPKPAKLIISIILNEKKLLYPIINKLRSSFGEIDLASPWLNFDFTTYYKKEMGENLYRRILSFENKIDQKALSNIKIYTNSIENKYKTKNKRCINIDPGYLLLERFVLASSKNYSHRIYIGNKIYADLTLIYKKGKYRSLEWTYPDYADKKINDFLSIARLSI